MVALGMLKKRRPAADVPLLVAEQHRRQVGLRRSVGIGVAQPALDPT
jgi:hypothetical protein